MSLPLSQVVAEHRQEHERAMRKVAMSSDAQTALVERRLRSEYDEMVRVLKTSHEAEMRRVGEWSGPSDCLSVCLSV